jgi:hypothetical protein
LRLLLEAACPTAERKVAACSPGTETAVVDELVRVGLPVLPGQDQLVRVDEEGLQLLGEEELQLLEDWFQLLDDGPSCSMTGSSSLRMSSTERSCWSKAPATRRGTPATARGGLNLVSCF